MKYFITVNNKRYEVIAKEVSGKLELTIDGKRMDVEIEEEKQEHAKTAEPILISSKHAITPQITVAPPSQTAAVSSGQIQSPMAGVVLKVKIKANDIVKRGDVLFILEAMKMENEIRANKDGRIIEVKATEGGRVNQGDILCAIG